MLVLLAAMAAITLVTGRESGRPLGLDPAFSTIGALPDAALADRGLSPRPSSPVALRTIFPAHHAAEQEVIVEPETSAAFPEMTLVGTVETMKRRVVIIRIEGEADMKIVTPGEKLDGWELISVGSRDVVWAKDDQRYSLVIGHAAN